MDLDTRSVLADIEAGLTDNEIRAKHGISDGDLARVHALKLSVQTVVEDEIAECTRKEAFLYPSDPLFQRIYDSRSIGDDERRKIECKRAHLIEAFKKGTIAADEFKKQIQQLVRSLLNASVLSHK
ncbi:MAG TPA: hypothetical protein VK463_04505 [Desulfomonilaceae bacterium]|nr:hypothetical protein [Desulfomonilaceae bacterium]